VGSHDLDNFLPVGGIAQPGIEHIRSQFDMVLQSISPSSEAECLVKRILARCLAYSPLWKSKAILVPVNDFLIARQALKEGISFPLLGELHFIKANFRQVMPCDRGT